jgi:hypothetical protein
MARTDLNARSGETLSLSFTCADEDGEAFNLSGYTARSQVKSQSGSLTLDLSPTIPTPSNGVIQVEVDADLTAAVPAGNYVWDMVLDGPDSKVIWLCGGSITFRQIVTQEVE